MAFKWCGLDGLNTRRAERGLQRGRYPKCTPDRLGNRTLGGTMTGIGRPRGHRARGIDPADDEVAVIRSVRGGDWGDRGTVRPDAPRIDREDGATPCQARSANTRDVSTCNRFAAAVKSDVDGDGLSRDLLVMWPLSTPGRWVRTFSLAGYLLSGIVATLAHDHGGSGCCRGPQPPAVSSRPAGADPAQRQCGHSLCKKHAQSEASTGREAEASTGRQAESGESGSISTRCLACDFLAQHVATPAVPVTPAVATLRWSEASAHAIRCHAPVMAAFLARGPPA